MNWGEKPYNLQRVTSQQPLKHKNVKWNNTNISKEIYYEQQNLEEH